MIGWGASCMTLAPYSPPISNALFMVVLRLLIVPKVADYCVRAFFLLVYQAGRQDLPEDLRGLPLDEYHAYARVVGRSGANRRRHGSRRFLTSCHRACCVCFASCPSI